MSERSWICGQCDTYNEGTASECDVCEGKVPLISSFAFTPDTIVLGETIKLSWDIDYADKVKIDGIGIVENKGFRDLNLTESSSFRLVAENDVTVREKNISVRLPLPTILDFKVDNPIIRLGENKKLSWEVINSHKIELFPKAIDVTRKKHFEVNPTETTTFSLKASNSSGTVSKEIKLILYPPKINSFIASSYKIEEGKEIFLSWNVENAEFLKINNGIGDVSDAKDSKLLVAPKSPIEYILVAENKSGRIEKRVALTIEPPTIKSFSTPKSMVIKGDKFEVQWEVEKAKTVSIKGYGEVDSVGTMSIVADKNMSLEIMATGDYGVVEKRKINLKVAAIEYFNIESSIEGKFNLLWNTTNMESVYLHPGKINESYSGKKEIPTTDERLTYELEGVTKYGDVIKKEIQVKPCKILLFEADSKNVYVGRTITLTWSVEDAERVVIDNGIGDVDLVGSKKVRITEGNRAFKITAYGKLNIKHSSVELSFIEIPKIDIIRIPEPAINFKIDNSSLKIPSISSNFRLGAFQKFLFQKLEGIKIIDFNRKKSESVKIINKIQSNHTIDKIDSKSLLIQLRNELIKRTSDE